MLLNPHLLPLLTIDVEAMALAQDNCEFLSVESPHHSITFLFLTLQTILFVMSLMEHHGQLFHLHLGKMFLTLYMVFLTLVSGQLRN